MTPKEDSTSPALDINSEEFSQLENFYKLLLELKIFEPKELFVSASSTETIEIMKSPLPTCESTHREISPKNLEIESSQPEIESNIRKVSWQFLESQVSKDYLGIDINTKSTVADFSQEVNTNLPSDFEVNLQQQLEPSKQGLQKSFIQSSKDNVEESTAAFYKLQKLLVGPELINLTHLTTNIQENLQKLEHKIFHSDQLIQDRLEEYRNHIDETLSTAIPSALENIHPEKLADAIAPTIGEAIKKQTEIEPEKIVDALYPIIGNTISKYMLETIESINEQIEQTFTIRGIKRKIRAKLQGVSEAELIVKESLGFKIKAIFLIHKASGLLISEIQPSEEERLESDMVAGMLTAIRDFANDCITTSGKVSELGEIDYGASKIILEVAGYCYLAIIVNGEPSKDLLREMRGTLSQIIKDYAKPIELFDGDLGTIPAGLHTSLKALGDYQPENTSKKNKFSPLLILSFTLLSVIAIPWGILQYRSAHIRSVEEKIELALASTPELSVYRLSVRASQGKLKITGRVPNQWLRIKAEQIATAATTWSVENQIISVDVPADPILAKAEVERVTKILNQISGTVISANFIKDKVTVKGYVREAGDNKKIIEAFEQIPGVKFVSIALEVKPLKLGVRIYFSPNSSTLPKNVGRKITKVKLFLKQHPTSKLKIIGYSKPLHNQSAKKIALRRAQTVEQLLIQQGIPPSRLQVMGKVSLPPGVESSQFSWMRRCVIFEVVAHRDKP